MDDTQQLVEERDEALEEDQPELNERRLSEENKTVDVKTEGADPVELYPSLIKDTTKKYLESFKMFFVRLFDPTSRVASDVYSYMFLCDFFNFFVILIGYSSFGVSIFFYYIHNFLSFFHFFKYFSHNKEMEEFLHT